MASTTDMTAFMMDMMVSMTDILMDMVNVIQIIGADVVAAEGVAVAVTVAVGVSGNNIMN